MKRLKYVLIALLGLCLIATLAWAGTISQKRYGIATPYWYGYSEGVVSTYYLEHPTLTANDQVVTEDATQTLTNKTLTGTGFITATNIANITRPLWLGGMAGWVVDSSNDIDDATAPNVTIADGIPAILWDDSGETTGILKTFRLPPDYVGGTALIFYALISSDTASGTSTALDWQFWDNGSITIDAAAIAQSTVTATSTTLDASCEVLTLTMDATGISAMTAGHFYTIEVFNATSHASANIELKGFDGVYTATQ